MRYIFYILFTLFNCFTLTAQCIDNGNYWNESWVSCSTANNPNPDRIGTQWLLFEFTESQFINGSHVWNANRLGESGMGAKVVAVDYSTNNNDWQELGQFTFPKADESDTYSGFEGPDYGGLLIKKILVSILETYDGGSCASLAEMRFAITPADCDGIIDECGVCDGPGILTWYLDADMDGLGDASMSIENCNQPAGYVADDSDPCDNGAIGWDAIVPMFIENGCTSCHGAAAVGGIDLSNYEDAILGGNKCGNSLMSENNFVSVITETGYDGCGSPIGAPSMNDRSSGDFDDDELEILQAWIDGGFPESCDDYTFSTLCGLVWDDINGDGVQNDFNSGIGNITVELYTEEHNLLNTAITNNSGLYEFTGLLSGKYYVKIIPQSGLLFTSFKQGTVVEIDSDVNNIHGEGTTPIAAISAGACDKGSFDAGLFSTVVDLDWLGLSAINKGDFHALEWKTARELNTSHFEVLRSLNDLESFNLLDNVDAVGTSTEVSSYTYRDNDMKGSIDYFYKIREVDVNGNYTFSNTVKLTRKEADKEHISIYPNPASSIANLNINLQSEKNISVSIMDINGKLISAYMSDIVFPKGESTRSIDLTSLSSGIYLIKIELDDKLSYKKLIVSKI